MCLAQQPDGSWCHPTVAWGCVLQWWDTVPSPPSEGVVPVPILLYPWDMVPQVAAVSPHSQALPDRAITLSLGNGP